MKLSIDHVNIVVSDIERSVAFYEAALGLKRGFEVVLQGAWIETVTGLPGAHARCVFMETDDPAVRLELLQYVAPPGSMASASSLPNTIGLRHVAFTVGDIEELAQRLGHLGVTMQSEPIEVPFAVGAMGRKRLFYFWDPDGTLLEVAAYGEVVDRLERSDELANPERSAAK